MQELVPQFGYSNEDFSVIDTIPHPFSGIRIFDVDEYSTMMFVQQPGGIHSYSLVETGRDYKRRVTTLKNSQEITPDIYFKRKWI